MSTRSLKMARSIAILPLLLMTHPAMAQRAKLGSEQCQRVKVVSDFVFGKLGTSSAPSKMQDSLARYIGPNSLCEGVPEMEISSFRDIGLFNLIVAHLEASKIDAKGAGWKIAEAMKDSRTARALPTGLGELGENLKDGRLLTEEEFKKTPLVFWSVTYKNYAALRAEGFSNSHILAAAEDAWILDLPLSPVEELRRHAVLNKDDGARRDMRHCLLRRKGIQVAADGEMKRIVGAYKAAASAAEKKQFESAMMKRADYLDKDVHCAK